VAFEGAKKRKTKEAAVVSVESAGGETSDKSQIQVLDGAVDADDDEDEANTYRRKTVCNVVVNCLK